MTTPACVAAAVIVGDEVTSGEDPSALSALARPKSRTLTAPAGVRFTLAGFRSRWTTPFSCAASSASAIWRATSSDSSTGSGPDAIRSASVSPSTSSSTSARTPPDSSRPWMWAMFGWLREARTCASRWNRASRSTSCANASGRILIATSRESFVSRAR